MLDVQHKSASNWFKKIHTKKLTGEFRIIHYTKNYFIHILIFRKYQKKISQICTDTCSFQKK